jgi:hypothetical protein
LFSITVRRKLHDDLRDQGETCSDNRVARLAGLSGIAAQIGYKRRPTRYGDKPAVTAENTLDRQFEVGARYSLGDEYHLYQNAGGLAVYGRRHRPVFTTRSLDLS